MVSSCFSAHSCLGACRFFSVLRPRAASPQCVSAACTASSCHLEGRCESSMVSALLSLTPLYGVQLLPRQFDESSNSHCSAQPTSSSWTSPVSFLAWKKSQPSSTSFWLGERATPRSLVSHVVLKVSAEGLGYFTTSSGCMSGPTGHGTPRHWNPVSKHRDIGTPRNRSITQWSWSSTPFHGVHLPWTAARSAYVSHGVTGS